MGLADFFDAVQTRMAATLTGLSLPVPTFRTGADKLDMQDGPPRIVWVPMREQIQGPHAQGGDGVRNPRPLRSRHAQIEVHVWQKGAAADGSQDLAATEALVGHLVAAINDVAWGVWNATAGDWTTGQASATRLGMVYILSLEIQVPLTRELDPYATVNTMPITPEIDPPS